MKKGTLTTISFILIAFFTYAQSEVYQAAQIEANNYVKKSKLVKDEKRNAFFDCNGGVIHIFLFEDGNTLLTGFPTTATEKDRFQVHLYMNDTNMNDYLLEAIGNYSPSFEFKNSSDASNFQYNKDNPIKIKSMDFSCIGPFTDNLQLNLKEKEGTNYQTKINATIKISKTKYASIGSGIIYSGLKNPSNIRKLPLANGDTSLIADDPKGQGYLTVMATYYPWGRNSLLLPRFFNVKDKLGIVVGTTIGSGTANFKNAQLGLQWDFVIGGSVIGGANFGKQQKILGVNYKSFKFGETPFEGNLEEKKYQDWGVSYFIGVQVDSRIFNQLFGVK